MEEGERRARVRKGGEGEERRQEEGLPPAPGIVLHGRVAGEGIHDEVAATDRAVAPVEPDRVSSEPTVDGSMPAATTRLVRPTCRIEPSSATPTVPPRLRNSCVDDVATPR